MPLQRDGQAGDSAPNLKGLTDVVITTAMIEAGANALCELDWDGRELRKGEALELAKLVLAAALSSRAFETA